MIKAFFANINLIYFFFFLFYAISLFTRGWPLLCIVSTCIRKVVIYFTAKSGNLLDGQICYETKLLELLTMNRNFQLQTPWFCKENLQLNHWLILFLFLRPDYAPEQSSDEESDDENEVEDVQYSPIPVGLCRKFWLHLNFDQFSSFIHFTYKYSFKQLTII